MTLSPHLVLKLDPDNVIEYARTRGVVGHGGVVEVEKLAGGVSCEVIRLHDGARPAIVVKQALPKLRVEADWRSDPARIEREVIVMGLAREALGCEHVPEVLDYDPDNYIYCMTSAPLEAENWKTQLLHGQLEPRLAEECGVLLARYHRIVPGEKAAELLKDKSFFYQLRIEAYLEHSAERTPEAASELLKLADELMSSQLCLVHADYTPKNFLVADGHLILLDYEVAHVGHGVFDVASILNHFYLKSIRNDPQDFDFYLLSEEFLASYLKADGPAADEQLLWPCLGALMLARVVGKSPVEYLSESAQLKAYRTGVQLVLGEITNLDVLYP